VLVLSRKANEFIMLGRDVRITVLGTRGSSIRIGIEAPIEVVVRRGELCPQSPMDPSERLALGSGVVDKGFTATSFEP
jgi:carbon storage regulator